MEGFQVVGWDRLTKMVERLADMMEESGEKFDGIVTVASGGLPIATLLHDFTGLPVASYTANSYDDIGADGKGKYRISFRLGGNLNGNKVLFIDDVAEHGDTFLRGIEHLLEWGIESRDDIKTATLFLKPHSKYTPDFVVEETDEWIIFPFGFYETVKDLHKKWKKEGWDFNRIFTGLISIGIPLNYVIRFFAQSGHDIKRIRADAELSQASP